jgi:hypothetical protein
MKGGKGNPLLSVKGRAGAGAGAGAGTGAAAVRPNTPKDDEIPVPKSMLLPDPVAAAAKDGGKGSGDDALS